MDILSDILMRLNLRGSLYFRTSFSSPWGVEVPSYSDVARFHYVYRGGCVARIDGLPGFVELQQGDLLIVPRGKSHRLFSTLQCEPEVLPLDRVLEVSGFAGEGALVYGGPDHDSETQLICGHFAFDPGSRHPLLDRLPPCLHLRDYAGPSGKWLEATLAMIGDEAGRGKIGSDMIVLKMSEIIFAQALRAFIEANGTVKAGLQGFADARILRALTLLHRNPATNWTVADFAKAAGMSRTGFALRFSSTMAMTPMNYLSAWRMQIARHELRHDRASVPEVAERVGYASEAAFARAFKKHTGVTPAVFRKTT